MSSVHLPAVLVNICNSTTGNTSGAGFHQSWKHSNCTAASTRNYHHMKGRLEASCTSGVNFQMSSKRSPC
ncbi:hypothetical protein AV530_010911 [Patagioenas fasciata monilis]|uniref:Uncharacterized protein n=1 Tax=Patagioenas fasciata monilis TaxID=372326 RepID=A0A1V4K876_PATFA|nr:hypothetical protein AV530_010911 [Patagioenas fasciata monilis]